MAVVVNEDVAAQAVSPRVTAALRLVVWILAAVLPWGAIALAVKMVIAG